MTFTELRHACGLTQLQVAKMMGYCPRQIARWDAGHARVPKPVMELLKQKLKVEPV